MRFSDLTESEKRIWQAAATDEVVNLGVGDPEIDSPEKWAEWGPERTVRAEVIADLLIGDGEALPAAVRSVRIKGARITGDLNLEATTLRCPLALVDCSFASAINLKEATAVSVRLSGSHVPVLLARQLLTRGDLWLDEGFCVSAGVDLAGAHISGYLDCTGGQFSNPNGPALSAYGLNVGGDMSCGEGFVATSEVFLMGAHIAGVFICTGGQFYDADGDALTADRLSVGGYMSCGKGFVATGEVSLGGAHISKDLYCTGGQFFNPDGDALIAYGLSVDGNMFCGKGFVATGQVSLWSAHISGVLDCTGGQFSSNPDGDAIYADRLVVDDSMYCIEGFAATGEVRLAGAHIGTVLDCTRGQFSNPGGVALSLRRATADGSLIMQSAVLEGILDLTAAKTSSYHDDPAFWPEKLRLDGFVYDAIEGASAKERLDWLLRNDEGYSPQIYDQLAAVYRRTGHDEGTRRVLIAKQRRRFAQGNPARRVLGYVLDGLVGYGYRTWLAVLWLIGFLILGTWLFGSVYRGELTPANKPDVQPLFQPFF